MKIIIVADAENYMRTMARIKASTEEAAASMSNTFDKSTSKVGGAFSRLGQTMSNWGIPFGNTISDIGTKFDAADSKATKFSGIMADLGKASLAIGATAFVGIAAESIKMGASFQQAMTQVETGAGELPKNMKMVTNGVLAMAATVGQTPIELAKGLYTIESAGYHGAAGLKVLKAAAEGAAVGNASMGTVADATTTILNAYGESANQSTAAVNQMIAVEKTGKSHMEDVAASLSAVLPIAAAAHLSFAQIGGAEATMTSQGMSALQSTQDLANTIRGLQNPNAVAVGEMQQLGLSSNDVAKNLGKRGLTGTLNLLTTTILKNMGPGGEVMLKAFNQSKAAGQDLNIMLASMSPSMRNLTQEWESGKLTMSAWRKTLPTNEQGVIGQFTALYAKSKGFNAQLRAGLPATQTYEAALAKMTGGATGLSTSLMLTGSHAATFASNVKTVGDAAKGTGKNVTDFNVVQGTLAFQMKQAKAGVQALADKFGLILIPFLEKTIHAVSSTIGWFQKHKAASQALAGVVGIVLGGAVITYGLTVARTAIKSAQSFGKMIGDAYKWLAKTTVANTEVQVSTEETAAVTEEAAVSSEAALGPVGIAIAALGFIAFELKDHWKQIWADIKAVALDAWHWINSHLEDIAIAFGPVGIAIYELGKHWKQIWGFIKTAVSDAYNFMKPIIDDIVKMFGPVLKVASAVGGFFSKMFGGGGGSSSGIQTQNIPHLAKGGIVTRPTLALIGEAGPEMVVPLKGASTVQPRALSTGGAGSVTHAPTYNINVTGTSEQITSQLKAILADHEKQMTDHLGMLVGA